MSSTPDVAFRDALRFWTKLGFISFGGPTGQIAIMHEEVVERRGWLDEDRFLHALSFCMLLPGPEAQQLATYVGWLLHGIRGGIAAGVLFVLPASVIMLGLAWTYAAHGDLPWVEAIVEGMSAAVVGIVAAALLRISRRGLRGPTAVGIAIAVFVGATIVGLPYPALIVGAALLGWLAGPAVLRAPDDDVVADMGRRPSWRRTAAVLGAGLAVWWFPILAVAAVTGAGSVYAQEGLFFSKVAVVTFGGAYAILAYVGREMIARFGLTSADVVAGLSLAETTPGPLILVLEFLGFLAAYQHPGDLPPAVAGALGALVTLWATFVPSMLWIFLGAPYVERLRANRRLRASFAAITAAVVGVIAGLALTVAALVLFGEVDQVTPFRIAIPVPVVGTAEPFAVAVAVAAFIAVVRFRVSVVWVVLASAAAGWLAGAAGVTPG
jgi:chromate transporter